MIADFAPNRIHLLTIAHFVLGLCFCAYAAIEGNIPFVLSYLAMVPHLAMVVSQASLLAIWAILGTSDASVRVAGFFAGVVYLELVMYVGTQDDDFVWLATFSSLAIASVIRISRIWFAPLAQFDSLGSALDPPTFQFSIKGLLLLTFGVAFAITVAKAVNTYVGGPKSVVYLLFWAAAIAVTGLASSWATLTAAHPGPRSTLVLLLSAASGALVGFGIDEGWDTYFYLIAITVLQALIVLTSLLVVRSCGYRLRRRSMKSTIHENRE